MSNVSYAWTPITKSEEQEDGTIVVHGPAATSEIDRDRQRLDQGWLDDALPRWMAPAASSGTAGSGGAVREQHDPRRAVGVGIGLTKADDGKHYLTARIVDPVAVQKIKHGVLKGFSVGIKNPKVEMGKADAPNGLVTGGDIVEVSVCDSPANGSCYFQMAKTDAAGDLALVEDPQVIDKSATFGLLPELYDRLAAPVKDALAALAAGGATVTADAAKSDAPDDVLPVVVNVTVSPAPEAALDKADLSAAGRKKAAASGAAMSDGSYPIKTKADLRKAVRAVGRGGAEHNKIRAHIVKRAKALGLEAMVPDNWNPDGSLKTATKADEPDEAALAATVAKAEEILRDVRALAPSLVKADGEEAPAGDETDDITGADQAIACIAKLIESEAQSLALGNLNEATDISILLDAIRSLTWFKAREEREGDGGDDAVMGLADKPGAVKPAAKKSGKLAPPFPKKKAADDEGEDDGDESDEDDAEDGDGKKPAKKKAAAKADAAEGLLTKAEAADVIRAAVAEDRAAHAVAPQTPPADVPETVTKADLAEMVKSAMAEARAADEERLQTLAADVAKASVLDAVKDLPTPGGPALTRTAAQQAEAVKSDAARLRAQAGELLEKADRFSGNRDLAQGYRERARELLAKADA